MCRHEHTVDGGLLDIFDNEIPVATISNTVANREAIVNNYLDPGEAQAFALADAHDGRLLTDDGDARSFAKEQGVTVVGSVGVLLAAINAGKITEQTADGWLSTWIDEIGCYVPYRDIEAY
jgi:predicted nucleic acid-binding protein